MGYYFDRAYHNVKHRSCFFEPEDREGWLRFFSTDGRFPISIAYPRVMDPFFDTSDPVMLKLKFRDGLEIVREDLLVRAEQGDSDAALVLVRPNMAAKRLMGQYHTPQRVLDEARC